MYCCFFGSRIDAQQSMKRSFRPIRLRIQVTNSFGPVRTVEGMIA